MKNNMDNLLFRTLFHPILCLQLLILHLGLLRRHIEFGTEGENRNFLMYGYNVPPIAIPIYKVLPYCVIHVLVCMYSQGLGLCLICWHNYIEYQKQEYFISVPGASRDNNTAMEASSTKAWSLQT